MNLAELYTGLININKPHEEHEPRRLYVSDVGKCPRAVVYRILGTEKDQLPEYEAMNKAIMFDLAEHIEVTLWDALDCSLRGVDYQGSVELPDRENWGGRFDIIALYPGDEVRIIEVKTVRGNAFKYPLPKTPHVYQAVIYHHYLKDEYNLTAPPILWYADRGGSNTPREYICETSMEEIIPLMDGLDYARERVKFLASAGEEDAELFLPAKLEKVLELRSYNKKVVLEPDWQCKYCDYAQTCNPDLGTETWAVLDGAGFRPTAKSDLDTLVEWAKNREVYILT